MGLGIGIHCERCGEQISYAEMPFQTKCDGYNHNLCGKCIKEIGKRDWDKEHKEEIENGDFNY